MADPSPGWMLAQSAISAGAGLLGVFIGSWMTSRNQKRERLNAHHQQQLQEFYSPMLAAKDEIKAKKESQSLIEQKAKKLHKENASLRIPDTTDHLVRVYHYNAAQWMEEIVPLYQKMATYFTDHMWLAEQSTRDHYYKLVHIIEVWKRQYASALSPELSFELTFSDDELLPLYEDIETTFESLRRLIQKP